MSEPAMNKQPVGILQQAWKVFNEIEGAMDLCTCGTDPDNNCSFCSKWEKLHKILAPFETEDDETTPPPSGVMSAEGFLRALSTAWTHDACGHTALDMIHLRDEAILAEPQKRIEQLLDAIRERNEIIEGLEKRHTSEEAIRREARLAQVKEDYCTLVANSGGKYEEDLLHAVIQQLEREQQERGA